MASLTPTADSAIDELFENAVAAPRRAQSHTGAKPKILGVGTAVPDNSHSQLELLDEFGWMTTRSARSS